MNKFEFAAPGRVIFGEGCSKDLGKEAANLGTQALLICGKSIERPTIARSALKQADMACEYFSVSGEPDLETIRTGVAAARDLGADLIIGLGGGSVLDTAKAIAILAPNLGDIIEYLEIVGTGRKFEIPGLPCIAIPTTSGTGSEATRNAVITIRDKGIKVSLRHTSMLPRLALIDPVLSWYLPPNQTAWTGMDALTQLIEVWLCASPNPLTDNLCRDGIARSAKSLRAAWISATDHYQPGVAEPQALTLAEQEARSNLALAALESGMALANARLGAVHGLAGPMGGLLGAPHGALCAALLPGTLALNWRKIQANPEQQHQLWRFAELGQLLTGSSQATADDAIVWLRELSRELEIPGLASWGLTPGHYTDLIPAALKTGSMQGNPVALTQSDLTDLLDLCLA